MCYKAVLPDKPGRFSLVLHYGENNITVVPNLSKSGTKTFRLLYCKQIIASEDFSLYSRSRIRSRYYLLEILDLCFFIETHEVFPFFRAYFAIFYMILAPNREFALSQFFYSDSRSRICPDFFHKKIISIESTAIFTLK